MACNARSAIDKYYEEHKVTITQAIRESNHRRTQKNKSNKFVCGGGWLGQIFAATKKSLRISQQSL